MGIELKGKEKAFYLSILDKFYSKLEDKTNISLKSIHFSDYLNENFEVFHGVTKVVLVPKNRGARYVLKIPIGDHDYCMGEVVAYDEAILSGVEKFFAPAYSFESGYDFPVYIQLRVKANSSPDSTWDEDEWYDPEEGWSGLSQASIEGAQGLNICDMVIDQLLKEYPQEEIEEFLSFCINNYINDIHSANFGWYNGVPMIFDYSGIGSEACMMRGI